MLAPGHRLNNDRQIKALIRSGQSFFLPQIIIKYKFYGEKQKTKAAFVVSTKVDKRAVARNRIARRLREAFRALLPGLENGYLVLIIAKKSILDLDYHDLKKQLIFAFSRLRMYNKRPERTRSKKL